MVEFNETDLHDARFERVDLTGASFREAYLTGSTFRTVGFVDAEFRDVAFQRVVMRGVEFYDVTISGEISGLTINGVDVAPLLDEELDRRYPGRATMRATDAEGFRAAWDVLETLWAATVERARAMEPALLHESVNDEWSFIQTLRHLSFATDSWLNRAILGDPTPWHQLGLPWAEAPDVPGVPNDRDARPTLDEVLALRQSRMANVRDYLATLTDEVLASDTVAVEGPGWPESQSFPVQRCLRTILNEEWEHRLYAERDLDLLEARDR